MPVEYKVDHASSLVRLELTDPLSEDHVAETVQRLRADPDLRPGLNILSDHSGLKFVATTELAKSIPQLLSGLTELLGPFRCALVVPNDASYGMGRMAEAFSARIRSELRPFRSVAEAEAWLRS